MIGRRSLALSLSARDDRIASLAARWAFAGLATASPRQAVATVAAVLVMSAVLVAGLYANHQAVRLAPAWWVLLPLAVAAALSRARFIETERSAVRLLQMVGVLSAAYALIHYPLMPVVTGPTGERLYALLLAFWILALACGPLCLRAPGLALVPPAFLLWSKLVAGAIAGLDHRTVLDVQPLPEVAICLGLGLLIARVGDRFVPVLRAARPEFGRVMLVLAVSIHLANYYKSFVAKAKLPGPPLAWVFENNPANMFTVAADNGHLFFAENPAVFRWVSGFLDQAHLFTNAAVFTAQAAAITAFFLPRRAFFLLLAFYDVMHLAIIVVAGANFWPWILLNVAVAAVIAGRDYVQPRPLVALGAALFILASPRVVTVAYLGWYDTLANNKLYFLAEDRAGRRHYVPTNYFTFYSYPLGHMDYGMPGARAAFAVGGPNGGAWDYARLRAGVTCDVQALTRPAWRWGRAFDPAALDAFVRGYHRMATGVERRLGVFPYQAYPHHFYVGSWLGRGFEQMDKRDVRAYIYRRESVCLSRRNGVLERRVISSGEHRIDVD